MAMQCDFMNWGSEIVTLEAIPTRVGDGWRILIEWVGGRIQYISWFDTLQDAEDWIKTTLAAGFLALATACDPHPP